MKVAIEPENLHDMAILVQGLKKLDRADNSVEVYTEENGEHVLVVCGEVHLERCIKDLEETFVGVPVVISEPIVSFRETVIASGKAAAAVTPNNRFKVSISACPLNWETVNFLDA